LIVVMASNSLAAEDGRLIYVRPDIGETPRDTVCKVTQQISK